MNKVRNSSLRAYRHEASKLLTLSAPILIGQLAITGMGATDTIMAGNYSATDLAAIAIGQSFWLPTLLFLVGFFTATTSLIAHAFGANNTSTIKALFGQSLLWAAILSPLGIVLLNNASPLIALLKLEPELSQICADYLTALSYGLPGGAAFLVMRSLSEGMGKTRPVMLIQLITFATNIPLNYMFIYGRWGAPELGGVGCGYASAIALWLQCLLGLLLINKLSIFRSLQLFSDRISLQAAVFKRICALGVPIAFTFLAEVILFSIIALIIAPLGTVVIAGHQIALSVSALTFMIPLSVGIATTISAGQQLGAQRQAQANLVCRTGLGLILITSSTMMLIILWLKADVAGLYSNNDSVIGIASSLLVFAAIYQIPDAVQICMASALRAYQDTRIPLLVVLFAYWAISVPLGWALSFGKFGLTPLGAKGMWIGLVCGLSLAALMLGWRYIIISRRAMTAHQS
ncbi:MATE family efflux transporter [Dasania marina]|uniref:MATE family efflux transporter n=1 Tax=Dasania marina TaxID=471499 RepID=UPI00037991EE|nr:MATE family efflux transporter [Dasania marina]